MDVKTLIELYRHNLFSFHRGVLVTVPDPLGIDNKWYWAEEEEEGKLEVRRRIVTSSNDITRFLSIHNQAAYIFDRLEAAAREHNFNAILDESERLLQELLQYEQLVTQHRKRGPTFHEPFLNYPEDGQYGNLTRLMLLNRITATEHLIPKLRAIDLGTTVDMGIDPTATQYQPRETPSIHDTSYKGRLEFVRHELTTKFDLRL